jgi:hypothetical protein
MVYLDCDGKRGGGVCAYINQSFKCETVKVMATDTSYELQIIFRMYSLPSTWH